MYKVSAFSIALFFSIAAAAQQTTVNKTTQSLTPNTVEISAAAIPMEEAGSVTIDKSTYHKEVHLGPEPESSMQIVEVSAPAVHANAPGIVPKVIVKKEEESPGKKTINISDRAQPAIPK